MTSAALSIEETLNEVVLIGGVGGWRGDSKFTFQYPVLDDCRFLAMSSFLVTNCKSYPWSNEAPPLQKLVNPQIMAVVDGQD